jgi:hypothetical protein
MADVGGPLRLHHETLEGHDGPLDLFRHLVLAVQRREL